MSLVAPRLRRRSAVAPAALALCGLALLLTGCGSNFSASAPAATALVSSPLSGSVFGGRQPVIGSTVRVYAAGSAGYGSAATVLASTTTDGNGAFNFPAGTYACPLATQTTYSQTLYLTSSGGAPTTGISNPKAVLLAVLGDCTTVITTQPHVTMNEATTIAGMVALQQFFSINATAGTEGFGTSATNTLGLSNAAVTAQNLVPSGIGQAAVRTVTGTVTGYTTAPTITITPEISKINTEADILAACINTDGTSTTSPSSICGTLFSSVASPAATDTLQAAYYLAINPTSIVGGTSQIPALFGLIPSQPPYQPTLTAAPADWTLGVTYGSNSTQTVGTTAVYLLTEPEYLGIDANGNVWAANFQTTSNTTAGNSITELSPAGVPLTQSLTAVGQIAGPRNLVLDPSGNVFVASYGTSTNSFGKLLTEYTPSTAAIKTFPIGSGPDGLASDGAGNIFIATGSGSGGSADLEYVPAGSANNTSSTVLAAANDGTYSSLAIDGFNHLWLSNNASTGVAQFICTLTGTPACTSTASTAGGQTGSQSIAIDASNNVWIGNYSSTAGSVSEILATPNSTITGASNSPFAGGGLLNPTRAIFDGQGNQWITNYASVVKGGGLVSELTGAGVAVSPASGFAHTFAGAEGIAIDASGNVWVGNSANAASATAQGYITEIVGAAAPVKTPFSSNLLATPVAAGTTTLGTRP